MKGLLLKEMYLLRKHCGGYALVVAVFLVMSLMDNDSTMIVIYPSILVTLIPITLLQNDEQSGWNRYCGTLPYSGAQIVSAKYLIGLSVQTATLLLSGIIQAFIMIQKDSIRLDVYMLKISVTLIASFVLSSVSFPLVFRFGAAKGQLIYTVALGSVCTLLITLAMLAPSLLAQEFPSAGFLSVCCLIAAALYALSWRLSISLYKKRE
ncbi:MAG: ABC-2 transporter permease [Eubacterium sp.]|nr:ABC-2 transporter permease [Eubacterium sp.]MCM1213911.1 ABC-2 transporter permease [Lachnospiraceae bacterium]MCM1304080.1 ABC-2 transporter permease [Butyrivibrio sp.]MCM1343592.1 ABC-2 transporter permease [Muribaculaceae bacterium]MCM1240171.1 ABC-2 transporter permease [Lachnospiraceae bacterium]